MPKPFNQSTFDLLTTREFGQLEAFKFHVVRPLDSIMRAVLEELTLVAPALAANLREGQPPLLFRTDRYRSGRKSLSRDYWNALLPKPFVWKEVKEAPQLLVLVSQRGLEYGFKMATAATAMSKKISTDLDSELQANPGICERMAHAFARVPRLVLGNRHIRADIDGKYDSQKYDTAPSVAAWLQCPRTYGQQAVVQMSPSDAIAESKDHLVRSIVQTFRELSPLLLAGLSGSIHHRSKTHHLSMRAEF